MMKPAVRKMRKRIDAFLCAELNACASALEQEEFCEEAVKMAMAAYTIRFRDAPPHAKAAAIRFLTALTTTALDNYQQAFFPAGDMEGLRQ